MSKTLTEIAQQLKDANKKVQLIYAFNGTGKTRLSREFKELLESEITQEDGNEEDASELSSKHILYYNAFTEDLFYWDNDLSGDEHRKLKIHPNAFTKWVLEDQGQDQNIITNFQQYADAKLTPKFNAEYKTTDMDGNEVTVKANSEVTFSQERGGDELSEDIKISKGEESNFIWSVFYTLLDLIIGVLNVAEVDDRESDQFNQLEYVFIDDPVSSLDENHLIELAVDVAELVKSNQSSVKFIITTHNPLFYNVLHNELTSDDKDKGYKRKWFEKYRLDRNEDGSNELIVQPKESHFSYHLYLKSELENAINAGKVDKYHFNFLRNILEKTTIFLGYERWGQLLPQTNKGTANPYEARLLNLRSHSKYSGEEAKELTDDDKRVLKRLVTHLDKIFKPDLKDSI
jgi:hypothetical protein